MSPPQLTGHAARAVISTERRVQIWDQFYISFKETIPHYQWCTREQLVKAACSGKTGVKFTVDELTEVIRGRKHKREAGVDSEKVDGEWLYRFIPPGGKAKASKMPPPASTPSKRAAPAPSPAAKAKPKSKPKTTPKKRNTPLRPRAKSPTKTPPPRAASVSRKRATPSAAVAAAAAAPEPMMTTRLRSAGSAAKKPRPSPRPRGVAKESGGDDSGGAGTAVGMFRFGGGADDGGEDGEGGGWSCAVM